MISICHSIWNISSLPVTIWWFNLLVYFVVPTSSQEDITRASNGLLTCWCTYGCAILSWFLFHRSSGNWIFINFKLQLISRWMAVGCYFSSYLYSWSCPCYFNFNLLSRELRYPLQQICVRNSHLMQLIL